MAVITTAEGQTAEAIIPEVWELYCKISSACAGVASLPSLQQDLENISAEEFLRRVRDDLRQKEEEEDTPENPLDPYSAEKNTQKEETEINESEEVKEELLSATYSKEANILKTVDFVNREERRKLIEDILDYLEKQGYKAEKNDIEEIVRKRVINTIRGIQEEHLGIIIPVNITRVEKGERINESIYLAFTREEDGELRHVQIPEEIEVIVSGVIDKLEEGEKTTEAEDNAIEERKEKIKETEIKKTYRLNPVSGKYELYEKDKDRYSSDDEKEEKESLNETKEKDPEFIPPEYLEWKIIRIEEREGQIYPALIFTITDIKDKLRNQGLETQRIEVLWKSIPEGKGGAQPEKEENIQKEELNITRIIGINVYPDKRTIEIQKISRELDPSGFYSERLNQEQIKLEDLNREDEEQSSYGLFEVIDILKQAFPESNQIYFKETDTPGVFALTARISVENEVVEIEAGKIKMEEGTIPSLYFETSVLAGEGVNIRELTLDDLVENRVSINPAVVGKLKSGKAIRLDFYRQEDNQRNKTSPRFVLQNKEYESEVILYQDEEGSWKLAQTAKQVVDVKIEENKIWEMLPNNNILDPDILNRIEIFLEGYNPKNLALNPLNKPLPIGSYSISELNGIESGTLQIVLLGTLTTNDTFFLIAGTVDPNTNERIVLPILIGKKDSNYLNKVYLWEDANSPFYFYDVGNIKPEYLETEEAISRLNKHVGQAVIINFYLTDYSDNPEFLSAPDDIKKEFESSFFPHIEANRRFLKNPRELYQDIQQQYQGILPFEDLTSLPFTFGKIKICASCVEE